MDRVQWLSLICYYLLLSFLSSSESSLNGAVELLSYVARQGEESGFGMPCLLIAAKNDLDTSSTSNRDSAKVPDVLLVPSSSLLKQL